MWAFNYERPTRVMMTQVQYNNIDTIINCSGIIWFSEDRMAFFDAGANLPHRSQFEIIGEKGVIKVNDLVGGQGRSGNFAAYEVPFVGSDTYIIGDHMGLDREVHVEACDHTLKLVEEFARCVNSGKVNPDWPRRTLVCYEVMCALFESAQKGCTVVPL